MVRHSTFQVFSDISSKPIAGYKELPAEVMPENSNNNRKLNKPDMSLVDKVGNVTSSCAGAGSSEFHMYINARKRETERIESIETQKKVSEEEREFAEKRLKNKQEADERTKKNSEKRKRKKDNQLKNKKLAKLNGGSVKDNDESEGSDNENGDTKVDA